MNYRFLKIFIFVFIIFNFIPRLASFAQTAELPIPLQKIKPIKILIVPGHDNTIWGAEYGNLKEADMNLALAAKIFNILKKDKRFNVYIARDSKGYTKEFEDYLANHKPDIASFLVNAKEKMQENIKNGNFHIQNSSVAHNSVSEDTALRLYGFNKWANENNIDAMIHVHFNDYPRKTKWVLGKHKGFVIYVPEKQSINSASSAKLAKNIFSELRKKYSISTYDKESEGLVPDQKLIALGANNTLLEGVRSVLVEYGYIYRFKNSAMRQEAYINMANLTARGIEKYFFPK